MKWGPVTLELSVGVIAIGVTRAELAEHGYCEQLLVGSPVNGSNEFRDTGFGVLNLDHVQAAIGHCPNSRRCRPQSVDLPSEA